MSLNPKVTTQDVGLEMAVVVGRFFFRTDHLHYGYWPPGLATTIENLKLAQDAYLDFLVAHIPATVRSVLDVGCGTGVLAQRLINAGLGVTCVSPSPFLTRQTLQRLKGRGNVFECRFEELATDKRYDLLMFSESFQYVELPSVFAKAAPLLAPGGSMLICDFFRKDVDGQSHIGGGHRLSKFLSAVDESHFTIVENLDITQQTAPTMDLANNVCLDVLLPLWQAIGDFLNLRYPRTMRAVRWKFRKKIEKLEAKYFRGARSGAHFAEFKAYRLFLLRPDGGAVLS
jgi:SAM-dependent methyltransferase